MTPMSSKIITPDEKRAALEEPEPGTPSGLRLAAFRARVMDAINLSRSLKTTVNIGTADSVHVEVVVTELRDAGWEAKRVSDWRDGDYLEITPRSNEVNDTDGIDMGKIPTLDISERRYVTTSMDKGGPYVVVVANTVRLICRDDTHAMAVHCAVQGVTPEVRDWHMRQQTGHLREGGDVWDGNLLWLTMEEMESLLAKDDLPDSVRTKISERRDQRNVQFKGSLKAGNKLMPGVL